MTNPAPVGKWKPGEGPPTRFQPGRSGNPRGPSRVAWEVTKLAREKSVEALETLYEIMKDKKSGTRNRILAAEKILERGLGKNPMVVEFNPVKRIPDDVLEKRARAILLERQMVLEGSVDSGSDGSGASTD